MEIKIEKKWYIVKQAIGYLKVRNKFGIILMLSFFYYK